jgi:hypothetical protein
MIDEIKIRIEFEIISSMKIIFISDMATFKLKNGNFKENIANIRENSAESRVKKGKKISLLLVV